MGMTIAEKILVGMTLPSWEKLEGECIETISLAEAIKIIGTPARTRTGANGLGNRCSIRLSYRGMCLERCMEQIRPLIL